MRVARAIGRVWADRFLRRRIVLIALLVGCSVSLAHRLFDGTFSLGVWTAIHALLPCIVYTGGGLASGSASASRSFVFGGLVTVVAVTLGFTIVNTFFPLPGWLSLPLNVFIPGIVATLGAADLGGRSIDPMSGEAGGGALSPLEREG